jgi:hypothetical protein
MNSTPQEKVVKCKNDICGLHFGYSENKTRCPFCHTEYNKVEEKTKSPLTSFNKTQDKPLGAGKKIAAKTQKVSFKIWGKS